MAGVLLAAVVPGMAAAAAGLESGDRVIQVGLDPTPNPDSFKAAVAAIAPGTGAVVRVLRKGRPMALWVVMGAAGMDVRRTVSVRHMLQGRVTPAELSEMKQGTRPGLGSH